MHHHDAGTYSTCYHDADPDPVQDPDYHFDVDPDADTDPDADPGYKSDADPDLEHRRGTRVSDLR